MSYYCVVLVSFDTGIQSTYNPLNFHLDINSNLKNMEN